MHQILKEINKNKYVNRIVINLYSQLKHKFFKKSVYKYLYICIYRIYINVKNANMSTYLISKLVIYSS